MLSLINNIVPIKFRDWVPIDEIDWGFMSCNPNAIHLLEQNLDKVSWYVLSENPNAIHILEENLDKVNWSQLSQNPNAVPLLEKHLDKVNWYFLAGNNPSPNAIPLLEKNFDKVNWDRLSNNPNIFTYDYEAMKNTMYKEGGFVEELMANRFHPKNMEKWNDWGFESQIDEE